MQFGDGLMLHILVQWVGNTVNYACELFWGLFWAYGGPDGAYGSYGGRGKINKSKMGRGKNKQIERIFKISREGVAAGAFFVSPSFAQKWPTSVHELPKVSKIDQTCEKQIIEVRNIYQK